jgi:hypothetical protein
MTCRYSSNFKQSYFQYSTYQLLQIVYTLLPPDDGQLASLKHVQLQRLNKLKIISASSWFHYMHNKRHEGREAQSV